MFIQDFSLLLSWEILFCLPPCTLFGQSKTPFLGKIVVAPSWLETGKVSDSLLAGRIEQTYCPSGSLTALRNATLQSEPSQTAVCWEYGTPGKYFDVNPLVSVRRHHHTNSAKVEIKLHLS